LNGHPPQRSSDREIVLMALFIGGCSGAFIVIVIWILVEVAL